VSIGYHEEGFLAIQHAVDLSIMEEIGRLPSSENISVQLKKFPYPPYYDDSFVIVIQMQLPFIIMLSFIVTAPVICKDVVLEKEKKLKVARVQCSIVFTARCTTVQSAVLRSQVVCPSVCPSVTFVYQDLIG